MEPPFEKLNGVIKVSAGYTGGTGEDPTYGDYAQKGHVEAIDITYDPSQISYADLLSVFWRQIDPTDPAGQFVDRGPQYRSAIFFHTEEQKQLAEKSKADLERSGKFRRPLKTEIIPASRFYDAEEGHQDFYKKHPDRYESYRKHSGRDQYLDKVWGRDRNAK
jgi:peptide methionine sulfoxide reductase msrA/msrB